MILQLDIPGRPESIGRDAPNGTRSISTARRQCEQLCGRLGIAPDQKGPWREFAAALRANADRLDTERDDDNGPTLSDVADAFDGLDHLFGPLEERVVALLSMRTAAARLYAVLSPRQRREADRLLPLCCLPNYSCSR